MKLDHIAIAAETLEDGVVWAEARLGVAFQDGGKHARFATHNRLLGLADGLYLEVIAPDPQASCEGPRWFDLDRFRGPPRLVNWICACDDLAADLEHGMQCVAMQRADLRWDMGVPPDGSLPLGGGFPTLLQWHTQPPPGQKLPASGCALDSLTIAHPDGAAIRKELEGRLDDPRIRFEVSDVMGLSACLTTPRGRVVL